ncbi:MAG: Gfo/Idh/MocA family oxidoreductase [Lentisphaeria bacterium]|nr:Gfo/Idh/MocA family oxidoreductase [Lentisphaeria bacterium]
MSEKKRVVLVGCGGISNAWFNAAKKFPEDIEFVGLVDLNLENAGKRNEEHQLNAVVGADLKDVLKQTNPDIVFDCTVPPAHCDIVTTALNHGCDVLGEKPMAETMDQARAMVKAAEDNARTYAVIQNRRYLKNIVQYRDLLASGKLGNLTTLNADFYLGVHFGGFRDEMDHVLLIDMAIHTFDQARFISGKDPVSVLAYEWNPPGSWYKHGASAVCIFEMSDGVVFTYRGSWCSEGMNTTWQCDWRAICEHGTLTWDGGDAFAGETVTEGEGFTRKTEPLPIEPAEELAFTGHAGVMHEFLESLKNSVDPQTVCTDNIKSLAMVHAAVESAETGKQVVIKY